MGSNLRLTDLTPGERFWLWRRRTGTHSYDASVIYGVSTKLITAWERDRRTDVPEVNLPGGELTCGEQATILRRRAKVSIKSAAVQLGVSHVSLIRMERDEIDATKAMEFWNDQVEKV